MLEGAISCDVDTLASIYKGYGLRRQDGYTYAEFRMGLENLCRFLEPFGIKATLFMVGEDFYQPQNIPYIKAVVAEGHEIANHTLTHAQGFRLLSLEAKEAEITGMEEIPQIPLEPCDQGHEPENNHLQWPPPDCQQRRDCGSAEQKAGIF